MTTAWQWFQMFLEFFFPASLLADPLVALIMNACQFVFGWWFAYILVLKPIMWFFSVLGDGIKR